MKFNESEDIDDAKALMFLDCLGNPDRPVHPDSAVLFRCKKEDWAK